MKLVSTMTRRNHVSGGVLAVSLTIWLSVKRSVLLRTLPCSTRSAIQFSCIDVVIVTCQTCSASIKSSNYVCGFPDLTSTPIWGESYINYLQCGLLQDTGHVWELLGVWMSPLLGFYVPRPLLMVLIWNVCGHCEYHKPCWWYSLLSSCGGVIFLLQIDWEG